MKDGAVVSIETEGSEQIWGVYFEGGRETKLLLTIVCGVGVVVEGRDGRRRDRERR